MKTLELKNTITEILNSMDGLNSRMHGTGKRINEMEDGVIKITQIKKKENRLKNKNHKQTKP